MTTKPNETPAPHEAPSHTGPKTSDTSTPKGVITEGLGFPSVARFTVNGQVKSLTKPVSGAELHRVAGSPKKLTMNGKAITDSIDPVDIPEDAAITAEY